MSVPWLRSMADGVEIDILVVPRASRSEIAGIHEDRLKIRLAAPPVEGKANKELVRLLARQLSVSKSHVEIAAGMTGRRKVVKVSSTSREAVIEQLRQVIGELA